MTNRISAANLYKNLLIEIRPRLQCVNVFINLKAIQSNITVRLHNNDIIIKNGSISYSIPCDKFEILPETLNCVQINSKNVSFRFSTNSAKNRGSFRTEVLHLQNDFSYNAETNVSFLNVNSKYNVHCVNCSQIFCKDVNFHRILPLPSDHAEPNEWFCHAHQSNDSNGNLDPKINDIFYSICYAHLNSKIFAGILRYSANIICKRCLAWIGLVLNDNSYKVWFNTIAFNDGAILHQTRALNDVFLTLNNILKDSLLTSARIILQCQINKNQIDYILLWILEKKLNVLMDSDENGFSDLFVAKVLFKFESSSDNTVKQWLNDVIVTNVNISKPMMIELLKKLYEMNTLLPQDCNTSNDFYMSYLSLYS